jgi:hypothetical protein
MVSNTRESIGLRMFVYGMLTLDLPHSVFPEHYLNFINIRERENVFLIISNYWKMPLIKKVYHFHALFIYVSSK